ncbi:MAG: hypothetical protein M3Z66_20030 [Chloroflexota bacterium]|nr:hypothetical protein [Chloroflexota bacterium]
MTCLHCGTVNANVLSFHQPIEGGRAFARTCIHCGRILSVRPRAQSDPTPAPVELTAAQVERLRFVQWRLRNDCLAQIGQEEHGPGGSPLSAA